MALITLSTVNAVSADSSVIYVNDSCGNDDWDGQYAEWISGLSGPKKSIKNATGTVIEGGTVKIANGIYKGKNNTNITINKNMTITGQSRDSTVINGIGSYVGIFKIQNAKNVTIQNLTIVNCSTDEIYHDGAIYNGGNLTVTNCTFIGNNAAYFGGAIANFGNIDANGCIFTNNTAAHSGGVICNWGTINLSSCNFTNNTANYFGGAIADVSILDVNRCTFMGNNAVYEGGAIYVQSSTNTVAVHFSRFVNNTAPKGGDICRYNGTVDAEYNWWGSNDGPSEKINGFTVSKWIVLTVNASSTCISKGKTSTITADLLHDSEGVYHDPDDGHIPDGVNVAFKSDSLGYVNSESVSIINGIATTTFISENSGYATVSAAVDSQTVNSQISVGNDVYVSNTGSDIDGDGSQSNPFKTIKTGISNVYSGGRLHIADGTYTGENNTNIVIDKDMTITGQNRDNTIINGANSAQIFQIQNGVNVTIANLTFTNGNSTNGGAIFNYGNLTVTNCTFTGNNATDGGAILNLGNLTVIDSYFSANNATSSGAISNSGTLNIKNTKFNGNTASNMGGAIENAGDLTVSDSEFTDNKAISGGAIYNYADSGFSGNLNVKNCTFTGNQAIGTASEAFGGAIFNFGTLILDNSTFTSNSAIKGGAIYNGDNLTVKNTNFIDNNATHGGAIYSYYGTIIVNNSNFTRNNAYNIPYAAQGGAIYNYYGTMTMNSCDFTSNYAYEFGGAVYNYYGTMVVNNGNFTKNSADEDGGAINNYYGTLKVDKSTFKDNSVTASVGLSGFCGGAIINYGILTVSSSLFSGNNASSCGGAIYNRDGDATVNDSIFIGNKAMGDGAIGNDANLNVTSSTFEDNHALGNPDTYSGLGGAIGNGGNLIIHFSRFIKNTASTYHTMLPGNNIYNSGSLNIEYNWWGSNDGPGDSICTGHAIYRPSTWLVLNITNSPSLISNITTSTITVDLTHDNVGNYYDPALGHVPDGIPVSFTTTLGSIDNQVFTVNGIAQATLNGGLISGVADLMAIMDYQEVHTSVNVDTIPPAVVTIDPANNTKTNSTNKVITVTFSEAIQAGSAYDGISVTGPLGAVSIIKSIKGNVLTITPTSGYINGSYTVNIPVDAVTDLAGNGLETAFISSFTVDTIPPVVTATPTSGLSNNTIGVTISSESNAKIYYRINSGSWHTFTGSGKVVISSAGTNKLEFYAVDAAGNPSAHKTYTYTIDKTAPKVILTYPKSGATGVSRTAAISIKFSENIKASINWSKIYIKNLKTGKLVSISKSISGNILKIKMSSKRYAYNWYQVYIPKSAVKDSAGNNLTTVYKFNFKTGRY